MKTNDPLRRRHEAPPPLFAQVKPAATEMTDAHRAGQVTAAIMKAAEGLGWARDAHLKHLAAAHADATAAAALIDKIGELRPRFQELLNLSRSLERSITTDRPPTHQTGGRGGEPTPP